MNASNALAIKTINATTQKWIMYILAIAAGVALITISAKIKVPLWPNPTPVTL